MFRGFRTIVFLAASLLVPARSDETTFVLTSDVHFGITRARFRGATYVNARVVNAAEVQAINVVPDAVLPADGGVGAGRRVKAVDFVAITGDLANRQELYPVHIQPDAVSWREFERCYIGGLRLRTDRGAPSPLYLVPGNHDVTNAVGSVSRLVPPIDPTSLIEIYNRMLQPAQPLTAAAFRYPRDRVIYARVIGGAHCIFLTLWPDRQSRAWMEEDLKAVSAATPVFLFCHDPPTADATHFVNPFGHHGLDPAMGFQNILGDPYADVAALGAGRPVTADASTEIEQREFEAFLGRHRNIVAYFHGHENWHQAYVWRGPGGSARLHVFRADSPMKGKFKGDETRLSFEVVSYDVAARRLTDRECLWNSHPSAGASPRLAWGESTTIGW